MRELESPRTEKKGGQRKRPRSTDGRATFGGALEEFLLGGTSTAVACIFSNPFDTVKTRFQLQVCVRVSVSVCVRVCDLWCAVGRGRCSIPLLESFGRSFDRVSPLSLDPQGELKGKGTYELHYRNVLHAAWTIARTEGVLALQKGLGPALVYQFVMNGVRLGTYQSLVNYGWTRPKGEALATGGNRSDFARSVLAGALGGGLGGVVASPLYLVRI